MSYHLIDPMSGNVKAEEKLVPFHELEDFLKTSKILEEDEAKVYSIGVLKGTITTTDIVNELGVRPNTAGGILNRLAKNGYFEVVPLTGRKGRGKRYKVVDPKNVLKDALEKYEEFSHKWLPLIVEHLESLEEHPLKADEIRLSIVEPMEVAIRRAAEILSSAKHDIKIYSHDCSWLEIDEIAKALRKFGKTKKPFLIYGTDINSKTRKALEDLGASVSTTYIAGAPFFMVDDSLLLLPLKTGGLRTEYNLVITSEPYLVENYKQFFFCLSRQKSGD